MRNFKERYEVWKNWKDMADNHGKWYQFKVLMGWENPKSFIIFEDMAEFEVKTHAAVDHLINCLDEFGAKAMKKGISLKEWRSRRTTISTPQGVDVVIVDHRGEE